MVHISSAYQKPGLSSVSRWENTSRRLPTENQDHCRVGGTDFRETDCRSASFFTHEPTSRINQQLKRPPCKWVNGLKATLSFPHRKKNRAVGQEFVFSLVLSGSPMLEPSDEQHAPNSRAFSGHETRANACTPRADVLICLCRAN